MTTRMLREGNMEMGARGREGNRKESGGGNEEAGK